MDHYKDLECEYLLLPEWGHAYFATPVGRLELWFPGQVKYLSIHDLLKQYLETRRIKVDKSIHPQLVTYHDPCNYGRWSEMVFGHGYFEEPRWVTRQCCENFVDMHPNRGNNECCGGGGAAWACLMRRNASITGEERPSR